VRQMEESKVIKIKADPYRKNTILRKKLCNDRRDILVPSNGVRKPRLSLLFTSNEKVFIIETLEKPNCRSGFQPRFSRTMPILRASKGWCSHIYEHLVTGNGIRSLLTEHGSVLIQNCTAESIKNDLKKW